MDGSFDLTAIQARTGIAAQRLRYVIDQGLLPGGTVPLWRRGRGSPRRFTAFEAFGVACAALFLKAGLRRGVIKKCMAILCCYSGERREVVDVPLYRAFQDRSTVYLEVGDGAYIRLLSSTDHQRTPPLSGWLDISTQMPAEMYEPLVSIRIDVARLRRLLDN